MKSLRDKLRIKFFYHWILTWGITFIMIYWLILWGLDSRYAGFITGEGRIVQTWQFIFLFASSFIFALAAYIEKRPWRYFLIFATLCSFFLAGEEISWGQRVFNIETPEYWQDINAQDEINIHNLDFIQRYRHWYLGSVPLLGLIATYIRFDWFKMIKPDSNLRYLLLTVLLTCFVWEYARQQFGEIPIELAREALFFAGRFSEIGELAFAVAVLSYSWSRYKYVLDFRRQQEDASQMM